MSSKEKILKSLTNSYWAEMETVMNYISNSINLDGVRAEEIKKSLTAEVADELNHAQTIAKRIKELGGSVPGSVDFKAVQKALQPPKDTTDVTSVIKGVITAEDQAIKGYNELIKDCEGVDYVTQDLAVRLLADEESHKSLFEGFLKEYSP